MKWEQPALAHPSRSPELCATSSTKAADGTFQLDAGRQALVAEKRAELRADVARWPSASRPLPQCSRNWLGGRDADRKRVKESVEENDRPDREQVMRFYTSCVGGPGRQGLPVRRAPDADWAIYRWLQVNLLMGVDLLYRYKLTLQDENDD